MSSFGEAVAVAPVGRVLGRGSRIAHCSALTLALSPCRRSARPRCPPGPAFLRADVGFASAYQGGNPVAPRVHRRQRTPPTPAKGGPVGFARPHSLSRVRIGCADGLRPRWTGSLGGRAGAPKGGGGEHPATPRGRADRPSRAAGGHRAHPDPHPDHRPLVRRPRYRDLAPDAESGRCAAPLSGAGRCATGSRCRCSLTRTPPRCAVRTGVRWPSRSRPRDDRRSAGRAGGDVDH